MPLQLKGLGGNVFKHFFLILSSKYVAYFNSKIGEKGESKFQVLG